MLAHRIKKKLASDYINAVLRTALIIITRWHIGFAYGAKYGARCLPPSYLSQGSNTLNA